MANEIDDMINTNIGYLEEANRNIQLFIEASSKTKLAATVFSIMVADTKEKETQEKALVLINAARVISAFKNLYVDSMKEEGFRKALHDWYDELVALGVIEPAEKLNALQPGIANVIGDLLTNEGFAS